MGKFLHMISSCGSQRQITNVATRTTGVSQRNTRDDDYLSYIHDSVRTCRGREKKPILYHLHTERQEKKEIKRKRDGHFMLHIASQP
jgi:hypothetical protein